MKPTPPRLFLTYVLNIIPSTSRFPKLFCPFQLSDRIKNSILHAGGTWWRSWLRHCATSRKVERSCPDSVIEIFHRLTPGLGSTNSNRNEYQEYFLRGKGGRCVRLTTLPLSCADRLAIWEPQPPGTLGACPGLYRNILPCYCTRYGFHQFIAHNLITRQVFGEPGVSSLLQLHALFIHRGYATDRCPPV